MIYGTGIRLPAEFFLATKQQANSEYANRLKERMEKVRPHPVARHADKKIFIFKESETSPYVFLRRDAVRGSLQPQYDGPLKVTKRGEKDYTVRINNRDVTVSINRLKPAFVVTDDFEEKTAESRNILILVKQVNAHDENSASSDRTVEESTRNTLRGPSVEPVFPTDIRQVSAKSRKLYR